MPGHEYSRSTHEEVEVTGVYELDLTPEARALYASALGRTVRRALEVMAESGDAAYEAGLLASEIITNGFLYERGVREIRVTRTQDGNGARLEVTTVTPTTLTDAAPAKDSLGKHVSEVGNHVAVHGRGGIILEGYTSGNWDQVNEELPDGSHVLRTSATIFDLPRGPRLNDTPPGSIDEEVA